MELRLLSFCYPTILCIQKNQNCSCTCIEISCGILSPLSHCSHLYYVCIKLHDNIFKAVVWLWKPFHRHFVHFRRSWDPKASIVNAFTTFLLLSFSKILFVSFTLLKSFKVRYNSADSRKCFLHYDATVECSTYMGIFCFCSYSCFCAHWRPESKNTREHVVMLTTASQPLLNTHGQNNIK